MTTLTLRIRPDKIAGACLPFQFGPYLNVRPLPECREGAAVVCRVLSARGQYGDLELTNGRLSKLVPGDLIVGVLGNRAALRGFSGRIPTTLATGDEIHLLNMGGVMGVSEGEMVGLGEPIRLEVVGVPLVKGRPAILADFALPHTAATVASPLIVVAGTCMNSGKSTAAATIIRRLSARGLTVHAGKATGVGALRDPLAFRDYGAAMTLSFLDCGVPSTAFRNDMPEVASTLLDHLMADGPDAVILELGDGLMGAYGVDEILDDPGIASRITCAVVAANDLIGGWAAVERLRALGIRVAVVTGPATDNLAGVAKLESLGVPAANVLRDSDKLLRLVESSLEEVR
jgi:hypothetical protein